LSYAGAGPTGLGAAGFGAFGGGQSGGMFGGSQGGASGVGGLGGVSSVKWHPENVSVSHSPVLLRDKTECWLLFAAYETCHRFRRRSLACDPLVGST